MNPENESFDATDKQQSVEPFSMERLHAIITSHEYRCTFDVEQNVIAGTWNYVDFRFFLSEANIWLRISSSWTPPEDLTVLTDDRVLPTLQDAANEWNRQYLQPTAYPNYTENGWKILFDQSIYVEHGLSDDQINLILDRSLDVSLQAQDTISSLLPPFF